MLVNDPPVPDPAGPMRSDQNVRRQAMIRLIKCEIGREKGAAGVLFPQRPAGYPFDVVQSKVTEQFDLVTPTRT